MRKEDTISYYTLPNGLKVVHRYCHSSVEYCGVAVNVGSRDESIEQYGLAHFVEHTIFKGTQHRRSWHIINRMEAVGGELNAYTTKEETVLYSIFPYGNINRAVELISDLVSSSQFPDSELDKEREVVADEINSYLDAPAEAVYDDFEDLIFAGSQLGHNILGTVESVNGLTSDACKKYLSKYYTAPNMVFFYMGKTSFDRVFKIVEKYLSVLSAQQTDNNRVQPPELKKTFDVQRKVDSHQAHTIIGARLPSIYSPMRYPISLLTNILGGPGMNSLLNISLREKRGLVYTVEASTAMFTDAGAMMIYFGCDPQDIGRCRRLVAQTIETLSTEPLSEKRLDAYKKQYLGQLAVASDNRDQTAIATGRSLLYFNKVSSADEIRQNIMSVTAEDIRTAAGYISAQNTSILTFG